MSDGTSGRIRLEEIGPRKVSLSPGHPAEGQKGLDYDPVSHEVPAVAWAPNSLAKEKSVRGLQRPLTPPLASAALLSQASAEPGPLRYSSAN